MLILQKLKIAQLLPVFMFIENKTRWPDVERNNNNINQYNEELPYLNSDSVDELSLVNLLNHQSYKDLRTDNKTHSDVSNLSKYKPLN